MGTTQVKSYAIALALITPLHLATSIFMRRQQPFNVCSAQLDILEWIDTVCNVWRDRTTFGKIQLAALVDLRFSAPELSSLLPIGAPCGLIGWFWMVRERL